MIPDEMLEFKAIWRREDEEEIYLRADHQDIEGGRSNWEYTGDTPSAQRNRADFLPMAKQVRRIGSNGNKASEGTGEREFRFKETGRRVIAGQPNAEERCLNKVVSLIERRRVANYLKEEYGVSERYFLGNLNLLDISMERGRNCAVGE